MIQQKLKADKPLTWVFTGDSITQGALHTYGWRSYPEHFSERIRFEMRRGLDYVINTGISGDTSAKLLSQFERRIGFFKPDVVFIMIGTNDAAQGISGLESYKVNLIKLVKQVRQAGGIPILNTPNPILQESGSGKMRTSLLEYVQGIRDIARQEKVLLIDHWRHWETEKPDSDAMIRWLADSSHPNHYGHLEMAKEIFRALGVFDPDSNTCKLFVP